MIRWALLGRPLDLPLDMLLTIPEEAFLYLIEQRVRHFAGKLPETSVNLTLPTIERVLISGRAGRADRRRGVWKDKEKRTVVWCYTVLEHSIVQRARSLEGARMEIAKSIERCRRHGWIS